MADHDLHSNERPHAAGPDCNDLPSAAQDPARRAFASDVLAGLSLPRKTLPCKYFYDIRGSELFEAICELPEYYPTRAELEIMQSHAAAMAAVIGRGALLIEYGSGSSLKTRRLLDKLDTPAGYVPVDISGEFLRGIARGLREDYPELTVLPVVADFTQGFQVPATDPPPRRRYGYFPGSTLGNFTPAEARALLRRIARTVGPTGGLLLGLDLRKSRARLEAAYDDAAGVTAAFNLNLLARINRELGADFVLEQFRHRAVWLEGPGRIEMRLVSTRAQHVQLAGTRFEFAEGEEIVTEHSHKYALDEVRSLARDSGFAVEQTWLDAEQQFSVHALRVLQ
jgi:dimethylhistidine N-methyltransferase